MESACLKNQGQLRYVHIAFTCGNKNNDIHNLHLRKEKTPVKVTKFEINKDNQLVICPGRLVVGRLGVQRIELDGELGQTVIETELDIISFSPLFGDSIMCDVWRWAQGQVIELPCAHSVPEFLWKFKTDRCHNKAISRK